MKKKLLSLFALLCLVLPACIGLVGCGSSKSDAEIITTALDQVVNIFTEKGKALNEMTVETYTGNENIATTYLSFEDYAKLSSEFKDYAVGRCAEIATDFAVVKGAYSNETVKKYLDYGGMPVRFEMYDSENNKRTLFLLYSTIDRGNNKITCFTNGFDIKINYDFNKNEVLSFDLTTNTFDGLIFIKYENSALSIADCEFSYVEGSDAQSGYGTLATNYQTWEENLEWPQATIIVSDDGSLYNYFTPIQEEVNNKIYSTGTTE